MNTAVQQVTDGHGPSLGSKTNAVKLLTVNLWMRCALLKLNFPELQSSARGKPETVSCHASLAWGKPTPEAR